MNEHPTHLLAEFVDDALEPDDRARVERHLRGCEPCRVEVADARAARAALTSLPDVEAPEGLTLDVLRRAREARVRPLLSRIGPIAAAAALVVAIAGGAAYVFLTSDGGTDGGAAGGAPVQTPAEAEAGAEDAGEPAEALASSPQVRVLEEDLDPEGLQAFARGLRDEARSLLDAGFPATSVAYYETFDPEALPGRIRRALRCLGSQIEIPRSHVPLFLHTGTWQGRPANVLSFLVGPSPAEPFETIQIYVLDREDCAPLSVAGQRL